MVEINVGIKTAGTPIIGVESGCTRLSNMLIGDGFHWERTIEVLLPGEVFPFNPPEATRGEADGRVTLVNRLPVETYLECVVGSEMNPASPVEFLKAHAVISRSWALGKVLRTHRAGKEGFIDTEKCLIGWDDSTGHCGFDVCSDDHCQRYQGLQPISETALKAIRATAGEVILNPDGSVVDARFSKCCGGITELFSSCWQEGEQDCLKSFEDPWCDLTGLPDDEKKAVLSSILKDYDLHTTEGYGFRWTEDVAKSLVEENLRKKFGRDIGRIESIEALRRGPSGRIHRLLLKGSDGFLEIGKELWIRRLLSDSHLYSSAFEIEDRGDSFRLSGRGWGHGVGLCQIGAARMAIEGHDYRSILAFYYPGAHVAEFSQSPKKRAP